MRKSMIDCWKEINPKFIISNGRTGTKFLSHFFNTLSNEIDARHEPSPSILKLRHQFGVEKISLEKALKKLKRQVEKEGIIREWKKREFFEKPSTIRNRKRKALKRKQLKKIRKLAGLRPF